MSPNDARMPMLSEYSPSYADLGSPTRQNVGHTFTFDTRHRWHFVPSSYKKGIIYSRDRSIPDFFTCVAKIMIYRIIIETSCSTEVLQYYCKWCWVVIFSPKTDKKSLLLTRGKLCCILAWFPLLIFPIIRKSVTIDHKLFTRSWKPADFQFCSLAHY